MERYIQGLREENHIATGFVLCKFLVKTTRQDEEIGINVESRGAQNATHFPTLQAF